MSNGNIPHNGQYVIRSVALPNLVADMAGDKVRDTVLIAYEDHSWEAPNQRWTFWAPWKWTGFNLTTSTRFGETVITHVDEDDIENGQNATVFGTRMHDVPGGLTRPWNRASAGDGTFKIYTTDCYGYPRFWTLEPLKMKIVLHGREDTDLQKWRIEVIH